MVAPLIEQKLQDESEESTFEQTPLSPEEQRQREIDEISVPLERRPPTEEEKAEFLADFGVDFETYDDSIQAEKATWGAVLKDVLIQPGLGISKLATLPLDILKLGMMGEALDTSDLEEAALREGVEFDKAAYLKAVSESSEFIPTQELLEKGVTELTGISLEPETETGRRIRQLFTIASFVEGGPTKKLAAGTTAALTTELGKQAGLGETSASIVGDVTGIGAASVERFARLLNAESQQLANIAERHGLPFWEGMTRATPLRQRPIIVQRTGQALRSQFDQTIEEAVGGILNRELTSAELRASGANLQVLEEAAYDELETLASNATQRVSMAGTHRNMGQQINRIRSGAPAPSNAQEVAIRELESQRRRLTQPIDQRAVEALERQIDAATEFEFRGDTFIHVNGETMLASEARTLLQAARNATPSVRTATVEEAIQQIRNYNSNLRSIYRKAEWSGAENEVRVLYEEAKQQLRRDIEVANPEVGNQLRAADELFANNMQLQETEGIIGQYFRDGSLNTRALTRGLQGRDRTRLLRTIGESGVADLEEISRFSNAAERNVLNFIERAGVDGELKSIGKMAALLYMVPSGGSQVAVKTGVVLNSMRPYLHGQIIAREATRETYILMTEAAAKNNMKAFLTHADELESQIADEYGSFDEFVRVGLDELEILDL